MIVAPGWAWSVKIMCKEEVGIMCQEWEETRFERLFKNAVVHKKNDGNDQLACFNSNL